MARDGVNQSGLGLEGGKEIQTELGLLLNRGTGVQEAAVMIAVSRRRLREFSRSYFSEPGR